MVDVSLVDLPKLTSVPSMACKWVTQMGTVAYSDGDYMVTLAQLRHVGPLTHHVTTHRGPIWVSC